MENKEFRNALLEAIKNELKDFAQVQKNLKKSRKLEFRPKDKSLQSICDEISNNAYKIQFILLYYTWLKHGKKYWANRKIDSYWTYYCSHYNNLGNYPESYKDKSAWWIENDYKNGKPYKTYGEYTEYVLLGFIKDKAKQFNIELPEDLTQFINK